MNTHNFYIKFSFFPSSNCSFIHSKYNFEHMQANKRTFFDRSIHSYTCIQKNKKFPHHTAHLQKYCQQKLLLSDL